MSGAPGSGKSTLASLIARAIGGVVIDHDRVRSTLIDGQDATATLPFDQAAKRAYHLQWALVRDFASQGHSVVVDSTCNTREGLDHGCAY